MRRLSAIERIERLVLSVAEATSKEETTLQERLESLKILTPYYTMLKKGKFREEEESETTFETMKTQLRSVK
jgi:hypothetical protein